MVWHCVFNAVDVLQGLKLDEEVCDPVTKSQLVWHPA